MYVANVVQANLRAALAPGVSGRVFNVGSGVSITVNELLRQICERLGVPFDPEYLPPRAGDVLHSSRTSRPPVGNWATTQIPQQAGLEETIDYYLELANRQSAAVR